MSTGDQEALSLTIDGGKLVIQSGRTLTIGETIDVGENGYLELGDGTTIAPALGGTIANLAAYEGDAALSTWGSRRYCDELRRQRLATPGTFTLQGGGRLLLDNMDGIVNAPKTTFDIEAGGTLSSKGTNPLGGARK